MNSEQAREILRRRRAGTADDRDPEVRAALALAAEDAGLGRWLADHERFAGAVRDRLRAIPVPEGLRAQIVSERRMFLGWRMPRPAWLAAGAVAALALIVAGAILWDRPESETRFATFRARMVRTALRGYAMDYATNNPAAVRRYLEDRRAHADWSGPAALSAQPLLGCAVLTWQGQPATMICYGRSTTPELWLFVVDRAALPDPPSEGTTQFARVNRLQTASWSAGGRTYLLAGAIPETELRRLLNAGG